MCVDEVHTPGLVAVLDPPRPAPVCGQASGSFYEGPGDGMALSKAFGRISDNERVHFVNE